MWEWKKEVKMSLSIPPNPLTLKQSLIISLSGYLMGLISVSVSLNSAYKGCPYEAFRVDNSSAVGKAVDIAGLA